MKVLSIKKVDDDSGKRDLNVRLYIWPKGESVMDNVQNRQSRPFKLYERILPQIFKAAGIPSVATARWSQRAGCSCPCSPGFILDWRGTFDIHVDVDMTDDKIAWQVTAHAIRRTTGEQVGKSRTETIDTLNPLFVGCETAQAVHAAYERFWNGMNEDSSEVVLVTKVVRP